MVRWSSIFAWLSPPALAFGGGSPPPVAPVPPPPAPPPTMQSPQGADAADDARRRASASTGFGSTILTGAMGDTTRPDLAKKSLLGD